MNKKSVTGLLVFVIVAWGIGTLCGPAGVASASALFSGLAFLGLIYQLSLQHKDLKEQGLALRRQEEHLRSMAVREISRTVIDLAKELTRAVENTIDGNKDIGKGRAEYGLIVARCIDSNLHFDVNTKDAAIHFLKKYNFDQARIVGGNMSLFESMLDLCEDSSLHRSERDRIMRTMAGVLPVEFLGVAFEVLESRSITGLKVSSMWRVFLAGGHLEGIPEGSFPRKPFNLDHYKSIVGKQRKG